MAEETRSEQLAQKVTPSVREKLDEVLKKMGHYDTGKDGHCTDGNIASVLQKRGIETDKKGALRGLHDKRREAEGNTGKNNFWGQKKILNTQFEHTFFT